MATAMPRRRVNQCEMSAISGAKVAELPTPITMLASANTMRFGREARGDEADAQQERAGDDGADDAEAVDQPADGDGADAEADHGQRVGQRGIGARHAEVGLHRRQRHHIGPHADAADGAEQHRHQQPQPGVGGLRPRRCECQLFGQSPAWARDNLRFRRPGQARAAAIMRSRHARLAAGSRPYRGRGRLSTIAAAIKLRAMQTASAAV